MIRVGVIGYGYWGPNLVRNFAELADARVTVVADRRPERLAQAERRYPGIRVTTDPLDLIADPAVDAVAIATPVALHFELASAALRAGKHVLVEKPIASTSDEASRLIDEAARRQLVLMVDHTFVYTGAVQQDPRAGRQRRAGRPLLLRFRPHQPRAVSAGCRRALGSGRPRSLDHGFRPVAAARRRVRDRSGARAGAAQEHCVHDDVLRGRR